MLIPKTFCISILYECSTFLFSTKAEETVAAVSAVLVRTFCSYTILHGEYEREGERGRERERKYRRVRVTEGEKKREREKEREIRREILAEREKYTQT